MNILKVSENLSNGPAAGYRSLHTPAHPVEGRALLLPTLSLAVGVHLKYNLLVPSTGLLPEMQQLPSNS